MPVRDHTIIDGTYIKGHTPEIDGKHKYARILIQPHTPTRPRGISVKSTPIK